MLLGGSYLSYRIRNIERVLFNESKLIGFAVSFISIISVDVMLVLLFVCLR
jgi:hypothetical protein